MGPLKGKESGSGWCSGWVCDASSREPELSTGQWRQGRVSAVAGRVSAVAGRVSALAGNSPVDGSGLE